MSGRTRVRRACRSEETERAYRSIAHMPLWDLVQVTDALASHLGDGDVARGYERMQTLSRTYGDLRRACAACGKD